MPDFGIMRGFGEKLFSDKLVAGQLPTNLGGVFDADVIAFFARVISAGGSLTSTEQLAIYKLVLDMKSAGIWSAMKAVYPMVGSSAAACAQNLKSSSFTGTFSSGWTFASTGATPNGTSAYMDTTFNASFETINTTSAHLTFYQRGVSDTGISRGKIGASSGAAIENGFTLGFFSGGSREVGTIGSINTTEYAPPGASVARQGFFSINTKGNRSAQHWINGIKNGLTTTQNGIFANASLWIGGINNISTSKYYFNKECAFSSIGDGLTDTESSNFYTAVQAFQTTLSRQV